MLAVRHDDDDDDFRESYELHSYLKVSENSLDSIY